MSSPLVTYSKMIKLSHTIFALPFALVAVGFASLNVTVTVWQVLLILAAMGTARSSAMGFNRLVDYRIDAANSNYSECTLRFFVDVPYYLC